MRTGAATAVAGLLAASAVSCANNGPVPARFEDAGSGQYDSPSYGYDAGSVDVELPEAYSGPMSPFVGSWHPVWASGGQTCSDGSSQTYTADPTTTFTFVQTSADTLSLTAPSGCSFTYVIVGDTASLDPATQTCTASNGTLVVTAMWSTNVFTIMLADAGGADAQPEAFAEASDDAADDGGAPIEAGGVSGAVSGDGGGAAVDTLTWQDVGSAVGYDQSNGQQIGTCNVNAAFGFVRN